MSKRYVFPELFNASGALIAAGGRTRLALRWLLDPSVGFPKALFHIWHFKGSVDYERTGHQLQRTENGRMISWTGGESAVSLKMNVTVNSGSATFRAHSAALGAGHIVDEKIITGPVSSFILTLTGNPVNSISFSGAAIINNISILKMSNFVNSPDWELVEIAGLPVSSPLFDSSGYSLDPQGPVGALTSPVKAAIRRVKEGTPEIGWPNTTDLGNSIPTFIPPNPEILVTKEIQPLLEGMNEVFISTPEPSEHAEKVINMVSKAPRSVHGTDAPLEWQERVKETQIRPAGSILLASGSDPYAALAFGFGTTLDVKQQFRMAASATNPGRTGVYMVTVEHEARLTFDLLSLTIEIPIEGELAAVYLGANPVFPQTPSGVSAKAKLPAGATTSSRPHLDPPGRIDGPWLQTVQVGWNLPVPTTAADPKPGSYVVARGTLGSNLTIKNEKRLSGGWVIIAPAISREKSHNAAMRYLDNGVPEPFLGENEDLVYSVINQDLFGRWSNWASASYNLLKVGAQVPAMYKIELIAIDLTAMSASAAVEFTWDWSHRSLNTLTIRLLTHLPSTDAPAVPGSVFSVGGTVTSDFSIDFSTATVDTPPLGVELITEESRGSLRTYKVVIPGISLSFEAHPHLRVSALAKARDRIPTVATGRESAWSNVISTDISSPIPPPAPTVPEGMQWSSVPDPRGISRVELHWNGFAPMYAIYEADETAIRRELNMASANLEIAAADRLIALRARDFSAARRAFRRIADRLTENKHRVQLPRGSRMIHFYAIAPVSVTGQEGALPGLTNDYVAVASPGIKKPEQPTVIVRESEGVIQLYIRVNETRVEAGKIAIHRIRRKAQSLSLDTMGPPIITLDDSVAVRTDNFVEWIFTETVSDRPWIPIFYRVVAFGKTTVDRGIFGGESAPSRSVEVVPQSPSLPEMTPLAQDVITDFPDHILISFESNAPLSQTSLGYHEFTVKAIQPDGEMITKSQAGHQLKLYSERPGPEDEDSVFRFDPTTPRNGRTMAWVPVNTTLVTVEVTDPAGRKTSQSLEP